MNKYVKRSIIVVVILIIVGAIINAIGGGANAVDKTPPANHVVGKVDHCINHKEWVNAVRADKTRFEKSLGVYQDGRRVETKAKNIIVRYPWCNRTVDEGYYQVAYYKNKAGYWMAQYFSEWDFTKNAA